MTRSFVSNLNRHVALLPLCYFFFLLPIVYSQPEPTPLTTPCPVVLPTTSRIVGGTLIKSPYMVSLRTTFGACSGTLITPTDVLTARHCEINTSSRVFISSTNGTDGTEIPVRSVASHPRDDIMLVRLARPADVEPVKILASPELPSGWSFVRAQGYGLQSAFPFPSDSRQRFVDFPVVPTALCEQVSADIIGPEGTAISEDAAFPDDYVCAGYLQSASCTVCAGDSGGAIFSLLRGDPVLVGIISIGIATCGLPGVPSFSVRVSSYIEWLDEQDVQYDAVTELSETFVTSEDANGNNPVTAEGANGDTPVTAEGANGNNPVTPEGANGNNPVTPEGANGSNDDTPRVPVLIVEEVQVSPTIGAGAIAAISAGVAVALLIVVSAAVFLVKRSRKNNESDPPADNGEKGSAPVATGASLMPPNQPDPVPQPSNPSLFAQKDGNPSGHFVSLAQTSSQSSEAPVP